MGIFTKKRDEPTLTPAPGPTARPRPEPGPELELAREKEPEREREPEPVIVARSRPEPSPKAAPAGPDFGIQNAMELMRKLPPDNVPLVVSVVKTTLESLNIDIDSIIEEAKEKRDKIAERISGLESEIAELEEEVAARREEIKALRDDAAETKIVQERLQQATAPAGVSRPELGIPLLRPPGG
jgi:outer membrane murein-binding lipoprotein Lpp